MIIETERLILRPIDENDAYDLYDYCNEESVGKNAGWKPHESLDETREVIKEVFLNKEGIFGIILKETKRLVGTVGLLPDPARNTNDGAKMLGYGLSKDCWGHGYMTEAAKAVIHYGFELLNADIITANCFTHNSRSRAVINKCGLSYEGTLRQCWALYDGTVHDCEYYSLTADEYAALSD